MIEILKKNTDTFATTRSRLAGDFVCTRTSVDVAWRPGTSLASTSATMTRARNTAGRAGCEGAALTTVNLRTGFRPVDLLLSVRSLVRCLFSYLFGQLFQLVVFKKKNFSSWSFLMHRSTDHVKL
jgi:hypothetical protein